MKKDVDLDQVLADTPDLLVTAGGDGTVARAAIALARGHPAGHPSSRHGAMTSRSLGHPGPHLRSQLLNQGLSVCIFPSSGSVLVSQPFMSSYRTTGCGLLTSRNTAP